MTCVAVLQCVERGLLKLDEDVSAVLHEFKELQIITGFDTSGQPILKKAEKRVTLRYVLLFSSILSIYRIVSIKHQRGIFKRP